MSLQAPHLDDRTFKRIMDEALERIPASCPAWTDFNASDPGITLLELMAWLTESMIYRLNRVPERDRVAFLRLLGVARLPPQAARAWVEIKPLPQTPEEQLRMLAADTRLEARVGPGEPLPFKTLAGLQPTKARAIALVLSTGERIIERFDPDPLRDRDPAGVALDVSGVPAPYRLWIGDSRLADCPPGGRVILVVEPMEALVRGLELEWECAGAAGFRPLPPTEDGTLGLARAGEITFEPDAPPATATVGSVAGTFLRARLAGTRGPTLPELRSLLMRLELPPERGLPPAALFRTSPSSPPQALDPTLDVTPFGPLPQPGDTFFVASPLLGHEGSRVILDFALGGPPPVAWQIGRGPAVTYEYPLVNGGWAALDKVEGFSDGTAALTRSGAIAFRRPAGMGSVSLLGEPLVCIRARVTSVPSAEEPAWAPLLHSLAISFAGSTSPVALCLAERLDQVEDLGALLAAGQPVTPFRLEPQRPRMLHLAFDRRPAGNLLALFLEVYQRGVPPRFVVEHWDGSRWVASQILADGTHGLTRSGVLELHAPDWQPSCIFEKEAWWLRVVILAGDWPRVAMVRTNIVEVEQRSSPTTRSETVTGEPGFRFEFAEGSMLADVRVELDEPDLGARARRERWATVETFAASGPDDRHCLLDAVAGTLVFGNGRHGRIPPAGCRIHVTYVATQGARGNLSAGTKLQLDGPDYGLRLSLLLPGEGGADAETNEAALARGSAVLRHRRRAVTLADFEDLARSASSEVALARGFQEPGGVRLVIVPNQADDRPAPSAGLIAAVREAIDPCRLVTSRLDVVGPGYVDLRLEARVVLARARGRDHRELLAAIERALRHYLHPLHGGRDGAGWPMGRELFTAELLVLTHDLPDVSGIVRLELRRLSGGRALSRVPLDPWSYPCLAAITLEEG